MPGFVHVLTKIGMRCVSPLLAFYKGVSPATWLNATKKKMLSSLTLSFFSWLARTFRKYNTGIQKYHLYPPNTEPVSYKPGNTAIKHPKETRQLFGEWEAQSHLKIRLMEKILHHLGCKKLVNNRRNYQPQLVIAGFLNHQQYGLCRN